MLASEVACVHGMGNIGHGLHALSRWSLPLKGCINYGLDASDVVGINLERNIVTLHASSLKDMHA